MSRIVAARGVNSVELQNVTDRRYWSEIVVGGLDERPFVRGPNVVLPTAPGRTHMPKVADGFEVVLHTVVGQVAAATYLDLMDDLHTVFAIGTEVEITLYPDAVGVGGRVPDMMVATTAVEVLRFPVGVPSARGDQFRDFNIECLGITAPLGWTIGPEGS
jgi:hypothetical protein